MKDINGQEWYEPAEGPLPPDEVPSSFSLIWAGGKELSKYLLCAAGTKIVVRLALASPSVAVSDFLKDLEASLVFEGMDAQKNARVISAVLREHYDEKD